MAKRADDKDGSCKEILTGKLAGKWRVQFSYVDEFYRKQRISRVFPNKTEAKEFLKSLLHGAKVESAQEKKALTLSGWFDWLAEHDWPETLDEKTIGFRTGRFNNHVRDIFGAVPLTKIDSLQVRTFYKNLRGNGVGHATIIAIKADLVRTFNQAITPYGRVPMSHANPFRLTVQSAPLRDAVAITPEQAVTAIACKNLSLKERAMLATFLLAGVRLSEQMALTREQLLFNQNLIYIDRAVKLDKKGGQTVGLPKGNKKRLAVMCPALKAIPCEYAGDLAPGAFLWPAECDNKPRMKKRTYDVWEAIVAKSAVAELHVGGVEPDIGEGSFERPFQELAHALVDLGAKPADLAPGNAACTQSLHQIVHRARGDAL